MCVCVGGGGGGGSGAPVIAGGGHGERDQGPRSPVFCVSGGGGVRGLAYLCLCGFWWGGLRGW